MNCLRCCNVLAYLETDCRQEWYEETYLCRKCHKTFVRRVEFQPQSELVASDTLEEYK